MLRVAGAHGRLFMARALLPAPQRALCVRVAAMHTLNFNKAVDKAYEKQSLKDISSLPPSALQGVAEHADELLADLKIKSIKDLANYKYYKVAKSIAALAAVEEPGHRAPDSKSNINAVLKTSAEHKTFTEILGGPVSALQGITPEKAKKSLAPLGIKTVSDLATWKYAVWAEAIVFLAKYERDDFGSR